MIEIRTGGIGGNGGIARTTGRQDVRTTILPPGALAGKQAFRKHFVSCNQTRDPFSSCSNLDYTFDQIRGKYFLDPGTANVSPIAQTQITQQSANWGNQPTAEDGFSFHHRWDSFPVATTFTGARLALAGTLRLFTPHLCRCTIPLQSLSAQKSSGFPSGWLTVALHNRMGAFLAYIYTPSGLNQRRYSSLPTQEVAMRPLSH